MTATDLQTLATQLEELDRASYKRGHNDGYLSALMFTRDFIDGRIRNFIDLKAQTHGTEAAPANGTKAPKAKQRKQHKLRKSGKTAQKLVAFVKEHPGTTAANVISAIQIPKDAPYRAYRRGLIRKVGKQFYPLDAGA